MAFYQANDQDKGFDVLFKIPLPGEFEQSYVWCGLFSRIHYFSWNNLPNVPFVKSLLLMTIKSLAF